MTDQTTPLRDRIAAALYEHSHPGWAISFPDLDQEQRDTYLARADAVLAVLPAPADQAAVTPPPALTEEGRLRARVQVLEEDAERAGGLAKVGARCMREGHQGQIESARAIVEGHRFALSVKLGLGTGAPWDAIHERVADLSRMADETATTETPARDCPACDAGIGHSEHCPTPETHKWGCGCQETHPPAAAGLPAGTLEAAEIGANRLDAWARSPQGRNFLAHALVQLARTGWLRTEPGDPFEPMRQEAASDQPAAGARQDGARP